MAKILPFPAKKVVPIQGLTEQECDTVQAVGYDLMLEGWATSVTKHKDGQRMCVFDGEGKPYVIGRKDGVCYLSDPDENVIARSRRLEIVLQDLEMLLTSRPTVDA